MALEAVQSYCAGEIMAGTEINELPAIKLLPALQNSAARLLGRWLAALPGDSQLARDVTEMLDSMRAGSKRPQEAPGGALGGEVESQAGADA